MPDTAGGPADPWCVSFSNVCSSDARLPEEHCGDAERDERQSAQHQQTFEHDARQERGGRSRHDGVMRHAPLSALRRRECPRRSRTRYTASTEPLVRRRLTSPCERGQVGGSSHTPGPLGRTTMSAIQRAMAYVPPKVGIAPTLPQSRRADPSGSLQNGATWRRRAESTHPTTLSRPSLANAAECTTGPARRPVAEAAHSSHPRDTESAYPEIVAPALPWSCAHSRYIAGPERGAVRPRAAQDPRTGPSQGLGRARLRSGDSAVRRAGA
jgi:hypothetical protein